MRRLTGGLRAFAGDGIATGKCLDALRGSHEKRSAVVAIFGGAHNIPSSIMKRRTFRVSEADDAVVFDGRTYDKATAQNVQKTIKKVGKKTYQRHYSMFGKGCHAGALSTFPQNIGRSMVLFYSNPSDIVFDPFAGHNSRMELTVRAGRHYVGCDLSAGFMAFNKRRAAELRAEFPKTKIVLHHTDSRKVPSRSESADFTITSPPYWDIEEYGDEPEQLGKCTTYPEFLASLGEVLRENLRVLRPGSYAVWFVNDFRKDGVFHAYHSDLLQLGRGIGFVPQDMLIVDLGPGIRDCFKSQIVETRVIPKRHEYGVVFRKPTDR